MADDKSAELIELVAVERGFVDGRMVEPGKSFVLPALDASGKPRKVPKWAAIKSQYQPKPTKPVVGDLKPKAAQAAVKTKSATLNGESA
jgi:hypothetical protein